MMLSIAQLIATLCCTLFAGAALYINLAEHPARLGCGTRIAATVWAPSYHRATMMQAPLAILSCLAGIAAWLAGGNPLWAAGALLIGLVIPVTFIVIMPVNKQLLSAGRDLDSPETRSLLNKWGKLHGIRSVLSIMASLIYLILLLRA